MQLNSYFLHFEPETTFENISYQKNYLLRANKRILLIVYVLYEVFRKH